MPEGESSKHPFKEAWEKIKRRITGQPEARGQRIKIPPPTQRVRFIPRVKVLPESLHMIDRPLVKAVENPNAATRFIADLRNPYYYQRRSVGGREILYSKEFGTEIDSTDPENGYFNTVSVVRAASQRYHLPMVIYDAGDHHARLVVGSPRRDSTRDIIIVPVWDPMRGEITQIQDPRPETLNSRLFPNAASEDDLRAGIYDLTYLDDPSLSRYKDSLLLRGKFARLQYDYKNCVPYCLFVGAMLQAMKTGQTPFKTQGISKFQEDFGIKILKREEITGFNPT